MPVTSATLRRRIPAGSPPASRIAIAGAAQPKARPVSVRMFRQGLGDCFLLTFGSGADAQHVLIDCGSLGSKTTKIGLGDIATDIRTIVGDRGIDLLIATHEHWDHVSGFKPGSKLLKGIAVKRVWLAWTENPADALAQSLETEKGDLGRELGLALGAAKAVAADKRCAAAIDAVEGIMGFGGGLPGAAGLAKTVNAAMEAVRTWPKAEVSYREPGDSPLVAWMQDFRIYVLGPPRNRASLRKLGQHSSSDLYRMSPGVKAGLARFGNGSAGRDANEDEMPFAVRCRRSLQGGKPRDWYPDYYAKRNDWRQIEGDWLHAAAEGAERLALQLDSMTNNTSLALAIERIADGKVLLFPADAQEGNWLSWHDDNVKWELPDKPGGKAEVRAVDLLHRTVFYKVGHHGSHNATIQQSGLELMKGSGLTAFIPVDRQLALSRNPKGSWRMPARALYRRLLEKCEGRVVRSDTGWAAPVSEAASRETEKELEGLATAEEWQAWKTAQAQAGHIAVNRTFIEFKLLGRFTT